jgi:myo-inositol-1(or 4)-monophosphatase
LPAADSARIDEDVELLSDAARAAAGIGLSFFRRDPRVWKKDNDSPVSEADLAIDRFLRERLTAARSDYGWLSEETEDDPARLGCRRLFVVDPIDGTRGFLAGSDQWTISLAVVEDGRPLAAALLQPSLNRLYTAGQRRGSFLDGERLRLQARSSLAGVRVAGPAALISRLSRPVPTLRSRGYVASLALRIAMVADGTLDLAFARGGAHDWDIAAADLILAEAGGALETLDGATLTYNRPAATHDGLIAGLPELTRAAAAAIGPC